MKRFLCLLMAIILTLCLTGCTEEENPYEGVENPVATITMEDGSVMRFELHLEYAPNTVANFCELANAGFYDGLEFFRVLPGVLAQAGCPNNDGTGDAGYTIKGEFSANGVENDLSHTRGVLSMARLSGEKYDTASSQFFILSVNCIEYDGQYAAFGTALDDETLETIDALTGCPVDSYDEPVNKQVIDTIRVDTNNLEFEVETIEKDD